MNYVDVPLLPAIYKYSLYLSGSCYHINEKRNTLLALTFALKKITQTNGEGVSWANRKCQKSHFCWISFETGLRSQSSRTNTTSRELLIQVLFYLWMLSPVGSSTDNKFFFFQKFWTIRVSVKTSTASSSCSSRCSTRTAASMPSKTSTGAGTKNLAKSCFLKGTRSSTPPTTCIPSTVTCMHTALRLAFVAATPSPGTCSP